MISAIIVDDEWAAGNLLSRQLEQTGAFKVLKILQNPHELLPLLEKNAADSIFLDISMPELSGLELAQKVARLTNPPEIVFVTAYNEFALDAFKVSAIDYVVKPVQSSELERVMIKLQKIKLKQAVHLHQLNRFGIEFSTAKCEELFYYLLCKERQSAEKWELIENLWPDKEPVRGESNLRTTVFRLNQNLEETGADFRVKFVKEHYVFVSAEGKNPIQIAIFPSIESPRVLEGISLTSYLASQNLHDYLDKKDYMWYFSLQRIEEDYYNWAIGVMRHVGQDSSEFLAGVRYLLSKFPWKTSLILCALPLVLKYEGLAGLSKFYQNQAIIWQELYSSELSVDIKNAYKELTS